MRPGFSFYVPDDLCPVPEGRGVVGVEGARGKGGGDTGTQIYIEHQGAEHNFQEK